MVIIWNYCWPINVDVVLGEFLRILAEDSLKIALASFRTIILNVGTKLANRMVQHGTL